MEIVNDFSLLSNFLAKRLKGKLPGDVSHEKLMSYLRPKVADIKNRGGYRESAVLVLFYPIATIPHVVFILRQRYEGVHSAQVSFPGGKREKDDLSLQLTALREAKEEIQVNQEEVSLIGQLSEIYVPPSNFLITPFVGILNSRPVLKKQEREVAEIIEVSLDDILNEVNFTNTTVSLPDKSKIEVPAFLFNNHIVWGATAMIVQEVKDMLTESKDAG